MITNHFFSSFLPGNIVLMDFSLSCAALFVPRVDMMQDKPLRALAHAELDRVDIAASADPEGYSRAPRVVLADPGDACFKYYD